MFYSSSKNNEIHKNQQKPNIYITCLRDHSPKGNKIQNSISSSNKDNLENISEITSNQNTNSSHITTDPSNQVHTEQSKQSSHSNFVRREKKFDSLKIKSKDEIYPSYETEKKNTGVQSRRNSVNLIDRVYPGSTGKTTADILCIDDKINIRNSLEIPSNIKKKIDRQISKIHKEPVKNSQFKDREDSSMSRLKEVAIFAKNMTHSESISYRKSELANSFPKSRKSINYGSSKDAGQFGLTKANSKFNDNTGPGLNNPKVFTKFPSQNFSN